jgi:hypothetical protein
MFASAAFWRAGRFSPLCHPEQREGSAFLLLVLATSHQPLATPLARRRKEAGRSLSYVVAGLQTGSWVSLASSPRCHPDQREGSLFHLRGSDIHVRHKATPQNKSFPNSFFLRTGTPFS